MWWNWYVGCIVSSTDTSHSQQQHQCFLHRQVWLHCQPVSAAAAAAATSCTGTSARCNRGQLRTGYLYFGHAPQHQPASTAADTSHVATSTATKCRYQCRRRQPGMLIRMQVCANKWLTYTVSCIEHRYKRPTKGQAGKQKRRQESTQTASVPSRPSTATASTTN